MDRPGSKRWRTLLIISLASAAWAFSFGLSVPLGALWLHDSGYSATVVGLNTSIYYLGVVGASLLLPWLMQRGGRGVAIAGMLIDAATVALFPWAGGCLAWFLLRLCSGVSTAMCLIPMETRVNHNAPPESRARDFGIYALSVALGIGLGPLVGLPLYPVAPTFAFLLGGGVAALGGALLWWCHTEDLTPEEAHQDAPLRPTEHLFSLGTAWVQGFLEGGTLTFLTGYLLGLGYTEKAASGLLGVLFLGVVLFQLPGAMLADRLGRTTVVLACQLLTLAGLVVLPLCVSTTALATWLFVVGACCAALYPLGLALLGERVPPAALARANAWYLACNCAGSLLGPWAMGEAIDCLGSRGLFVAGAAAMLLALATWALPRRRSPPKPLGHQPDVDSRRAA
jgi:MFS family permease